MSSGAPGRVVNVGRPYSVASRARLGYEVRDDEVGLIDHRLPLAESHTVGGPIIARLRHLPDVGEYIVESGYRCTVQKASESAVELVRVEPAGRR